MACTRVATGLTVEQWDNKFFTEYLTENRFSGEFGTDENNIIQVKENLTKTRGDKAVRAQSIRGRMALEGLHVPTNAPWHPDLRAELLSFPYGKHDDQVDALGLCGQLLDRMQVGVRAPKPPIDLAERRRQMIAARDKSWVGAYDRLAKREGEKIESWKVM
jgi:hypothetical protein